MLNAIDNAWATMDYDNEAAISNGLNRMFEEFIQRQRDQQAQQPLPPESA